MVVIVRMLGVATRGKGSVEFVIECPSRSGTVQGIGWRRDGSLLFTWSPFIWMQNL